MAYGIFTTNNVRFGKTTARLPINNTERLSGITVVGNTFSVNTVDNYFIEMQLIAAGVGGQMSFFIELYNETLGAAVQTFVGVATPESGGAFCPFIFSFANANVNHFYSIRITPQGSGSAQNMLTVLNGRVLVSAFSSGGGTINPSQVVLVTRVLSIDLLVAGVYTFPMPPGGIPVFTDEIGLACTALVGGIITQPVIQAGIVGNNSKKLGPVTTTLLTAVDEREIYTLLKSDKAELTATIEVVTPATGPSSYMASAYEKIMTEM